jgi:hypothetical protein
MNVFTASTGMERSGMKAEAVKTVARLAGYFRSELI